MCGVFVLTAITEEKELSHTSLSLIRPADKQQQRLIFYKKRHPSYYYKGKLHCEKHCRETEGSART